MLIQVTYTSDIEARLHIHCCCGKAVIIIYSECMFIDLFIQHVKGMRRIKL
jgi:hypothetical protein